MGVLFSLRLQLSITIDNVAIDQNTSLPPTQVAVISAVIHLAFLMIEVPLATHITPYLTASKHLISTPLFTILGMLSLWTVCHRTHQMVTSVTGTIFLSGVLAFDALSLGLTPAVTDIVKIVIFGVLVFSPLFLCLSPVTSHSGPTVRGRFGYAEVAVFLGLAGYII